MNCELLVEWTTVCWRQIWKKWWNFARTYLNSIWLEKKLDASNGLRWSHWKKQGVNQVKLRYNWTLTNTDRLESARLVMIERWNLLSMIGRCQVDFVKIRDAGQILQIPTDFQVCKLQVMSIKSKLHDQRKLMDFEIILKKTHKNRNF